MDNSRPKACETDEIEIISTSDHVEAAATASKDDRIRSESKRNDQVKRENVDEKFFHLLELNCNFSHGCCFYVLRVIYTNL